MKSKEEIFELCKFRYLTILNNEEIIIELKNLFNISPSNVIVKEHSICNFTYHHMGLYPSINATIYFYKEEKYIGYYSIYWDLDFEFMDEFFVFD